MKASSPELKLWAKRTKPCGLKSSLEEALFSQRGDSFPRGPEKLAPLGFMVLLNLAQCCTIVDETENFGYGGGIMETQFIYLIVILALFAVLALAAIFHYRRSRVSIKGPGVGFEMEGEAGPEQPQPAPQKPGPSARTTIGGKVSGSTVITSAAGGEAETDVEEDVEKSDILTEA
jgi:hypothetical protein